MTSDVQNYVISLRSELAEQLGYVADDDDPLVALMFLSKRMQEDQHAGLLEVLTQIQTLSRTLTADGREQITQYASELGRRLGNEMRQQVNPDTMADDIVTGCAPGISTEVAAALKGHLDNHANAVGEQLREAMLQHDEQLFWHVDQSLNVHTKISTRNMFAQMALTVAISIMAFVMLSDSQHLYERLGANLPVEQERVATEPPPSLVPPPLPKSTQDDGR